MKQNTADILDEAIYEQRRMDWILFKNEQMHQNRYIEGEYNVGDWGFNRPVQRRELRKIADILPIDNFKLYSSDPDDNFYYNTVDNYRMNYCSDCEVYGDAQDLNCWFCEARYAEKLLKNGPMHIDFDIDYNQFIITTPTDQIYISRDDLLQIFNDTTSELSERLQEFGRTVSDRVQEMARYMARAQEAFNRATFFRGQSVQFTIIDEAPAMSPIGPIQFPADLDLSVEPAVALPDPPFPRYNWTNLQLANADYSTQMFLERRRHNDHRNPPGR